MFEPAVYQARRAALCAALSAQLREAGVSVGLILLPGNAESPMNYTDNTYRFRQDSAFLYCFGLAEPDMAATIDVASGRTTLYADELTVDMLVWTGPRLGVAALAAACAADDVQPSAALPCTLRAAAARDGLPLFLPPYRGETCLRLAAWLDVPAAMLADKASLPLIKAMIALRQIKEEREVEQIEQAVNTTIAMHRAVMALGTPGRSEAALMAEATRVALAGGGMPSFPPIATVRGAVLHNHGYPGYLRSGDLFLLDAGAETVMGYAGDLTTTFPVDGKYSPQQRAIYEIVLAAGKAAAGLLKPGLPFKEAHFAAARTIVEGLQALGLMSGPLDEIIAAGAHALFFPHGLGHQMGLDVHDMESLGEAQVGYDGQPKSTQFGLKSLRLAKPLLAGMVLTIEPGIYFIEGLIALWRAEGRFKQYIHYDRLEPWLQAGGYRNEENWLIRADGAHLLGARFDKSVAGMETALAGRRS
ncbi:MAG TPA: Xaa-Pro aminopeptidase [Spirochaetaceae bacterium]|nr:Xaa-Pro aminopeptidase [Spirochaetaceae bacterium]HBO41221.1 Xaa-Pro aminopeptidase [Spirochaetaceae bacterium]